MINPDSGHPLMLYMATQAGMGISLQDLFTMFLGKSEDGPMLGRVEHGERTGAVQARPPSTR